MGPAGYTEEKLKARDDAFIKLNKEKNEIDKLKTQIINLKPKISKEKQGTSNPNITFDEKYFKVIQNEEENRLQLKFDEKPNQETTKALKKHGFKYFPKNNVW